MTEQTIVLTAQNTPASPVETLKEPKPPEDMDFSARVAAAVVSAATVFLSFPLALRPYKFAVVVDDEPVVTLDDSITLDSLREQVESARNKFGDADGWFEDMLAELSS